MYVFSNLTAQIVLLNILPLGNCQSDIKFKSNINIKVNWVNFRNKIMTKQTVLSPMTWYVLLTLNNRFSLPESLWGQITHN